MPDYKEMYLKLFRAQTQAIEIMKKAQQETEEMYISSPPPSLTVLDSREPGDEYVGSEQ